MVAQRRGEEPFMGVRFVRILTTRDDSHARQHSRTSAATPSRPLFLCSQVTISGPIVHIDHLPCPDHLGIPIVHEDGGERPPGVPQTITEEVTGSQVNTRI